MTKRERQMQEYVNELHSVKSDIKIDQLAEKVASLESTLTGRGERLELAQDLLRKLYQRAYMRQSYHEADEIADFLGIKRPTEHEQEDLR